MDHREMPFDYQEEKISSDKIKKKSFYKRYFWQILAIIAIAMVIVFGSTTVILLFKSLQNSQEPASLIRLTTTVTVPLTSTAMATSEPTVMPTPTLTPTPQSGTVCETGSLDSWKDWQVQEPWKFLPTNHQLLLHDGSSSGTLIAPAFCQPKAPDYAVEARIKHINEDESGHFGVIVRGGYTGAIYNSNYSSIRVSGNNTSICFKELAIDSSYHTYRIEARGNEIKLLVDSSEICTATDNRYLSPGQVGLFSNTQVEVTDFKVTLL